MSRPSDAFEQDELREEYDWMYEFQSRMAERITGDKDVHNLVDYVDKLEAENAKLRDELDFCLKHVPNCDGCEAMLDCWECLRADSSQKERKRLDYENAELRELVRNMWNCVASLAEDSIYHIEGAVCGCGISCVVNGEDCSAHKLRERLRELGVEV